MCEAIFLMLQQTPERETRISSESSTLVTFILQGLRKTRFVLTVRAFALTFLLATACCRRYATLSTVVEEIVPRLLVLLVDPVEKTRALVLTILRDACVGYQHSAKLLLDNADRLLQTLKVTNSSALAQIVQCMLYVHNRLPHTKANSALASLVRLSFDFVQSGENG